MLTLTEELFLLSLREKKDTVGLPYSSSLPYALAGAMLVELALSGKVQLDKAKKVLPVGDPQPAANERLNELLSQIRQSARPKKITHWITIVAGKGKKLEKDLLAELIARDVLKKVEKKLLWVIPYTEYSQQDASAKYQRKQDLRDIVLAGKTPDPQSIALFSLLKAIDHLDFIFTLDEIKAASGRVNEIIKDEAVGEALIETLNTIAFAALAAAAANTSMI
jgi:hypothetical protein